MLEKTLECPLDSKEIKPFSPKGNQSWTFFERIDAEAPILWPPDTKSQLVGKVPDAGKDWGQKEKDVTEEEMVGRHHGLNWTRVWAKLHETVKDKEAWYAAIHRVTKSWTGYNNWTAKIKVNKNICSQVLHSVKGKLAESTF